MEEPTYEEALAHFRTQEVYWKAIIDGIRKARENEISNLKRNMHTPNCNQRADDKIMGYMIALEDMAFEFEGRSSVEITETDSQ